ncbi:5270_t:CDS:1, partial [Acaulospora morrowiae]
MFIYFFNPKVAVTLLLGDLPSADVVLLESQANGNYSVYNGMHGKSNNKNLGRNQWNLA